MPRTPLLPSRYSCGATARIRTPHPRTCRSSTNAAIPRIDRRSRPVNPPAAALEATGERRSTWVPEVTSGTLLQTYCNKPPRRRGAPSGLSPGPPPAGSARRPETPPEGGSPVGVAAGATAGGVGNTTGTPGRDTRLGVHRCETPARAQPKQGDGTVNAAPPPGTGARPHDVPPGAPSGPAVSRAGPRDRRADTSQEVAVNTGDTAWVLASAALVLLMTPGLALFYGGMVRAKSVLNMMMMSFGALALISVLWVLYGYSMAFGNDVGGGLVGNPLEFFGLSSLLGTNGLDGGFQPESLVFTVPSLAFVAFQAMFAIITVALISGAIADRARFGPWMVFAGVWATIVYFPVAHW